MKETNFVKETLKLAGENKYCEVAAESRFLAATEAAKP